MFAYKAVYAYVLRAYVYVDVYAYVCVNVEYVYEYVN